MFLDQELPEPSLVCHHMRQVYLLCLRGFHPEIVGNRGPHVLPAENVTIRDVERFVCCLRISSHPYASTCKQFAVGDIVECVRVGFRPRMTQRQTQSLRNRGIDGQHHDQVHWVADGEAADGMRPSGGPCPRLALLTVHDECLLELGGMWPGSVSLAGVLKGPR